MRTYVGCPWIPSAVLLTNVIFSIRVMFKTQGQVKSPSGKITECCMSLVWKRMALVAISQRGMPVNIPPRFPRYRLSVQVLPVGVENGGPESCNPSRDPIASYVQPELRGWNGDERILIVSSFCSQQRDDLEDDELHTHQLTEGMPTTMAGFKNHPLCVHTFPFFLSLAIFCGV